MTSRTGWAAIAVAAAWTAGCAHHEPVETGDYAMMEPVVEPAPPVREITAFADADRDGRVTRGEAEVDPALARVFDRYDLDDNGELDRGEFARLEDESAERRAAPVSRAAASEGEVRTDDAPADPHGETGPSPLRPRYVGHPGP